MLFFLPAWLIWHNLHLYLHSTEFLLVCTLTSAGKRSRQHIPKFTNEILRKGVESFQS